jgi:hypothetical protein
MPSFISAAVAALSLSSLASANVAYRRQEASLAPFAVTANSSTSSTQLSTSSSVPLGTGSSSIISSSSGSTRSSSASTTGAGAGSGPGSNSTTSATGSSATSTGPASTPSSYTTTPFGGVSFLVEIDITYEGTDLDLAIVFAKRAGESLNDCLRTCAANTQCVGTAFKSNDDTCSFFSKITSGPQNAPGVTFATVTSRNNAPGNNSTSSAPINNGTSSTRGSTFPTSTRTNNGTSVTASPNPGNNGTSPFPNAESIICPEYNDQVLQNTDGSQYLIRCGLNIEGNVLSTRKARMIRRQATFGNDWIVDCVETCGATATCVGTSYNSVLGTCTFYSTVEALIPDANTDSAILVNETPNGGSTSLVPVVSTQTVTEGDVTRTITTTPLTTSTVYSTTTRTIQSCAPGVPCSAATVTEVVVAYTTVCPVSALPTGGAVGGAVGGAATTVKVCTACQYQPSTVTVYQCPTGVNGAPGKPTAVTTTVIQVPVLAGPTGALTTSTVYQTQEHVTTTCGANGCGKATVTAIVSLYTTVCPVSSGAPGAPGASAPGAPASETVVVPGTVVPASTKPAETVPAVVENGSTKPAETVPATVVPGSTKKPSTTIVQYTPTSSLVAFTGAAVKNGMGFAAMAAGVAALVL